MSKNLKEQFLATSKENVKDTQLEELEEIREEDFHKRLDEDS
jgi:hypothetical protein